MPESLGWLVGYPALAVVCFLSGVALPMPEDVAQVAAGTQIATGRLDWLPAIAAVATGVFLRDALFFTAGRSLGGRALDHPWALRMIGAPRLASAKARVQARGSTAVLIGRFSVGFRTSTFFVAGAMGVRPRDFALWDGIALMASVPLLLGTGFLFGDPVIAVAQHAARHASWALLAIAAIGVLALWLKPNAPEPAEPVATSDGG